MKKFEVNWCKTYRVSGVVKVEANSLEEAEELTRENIGDFQGSMQYDPEEDFVEAWEADQESNPIPNHRGMEKQGGEK